MGTKQKSNLIKLCVAAMFAALIWVGTILIAIPTPLGGYINFGDCFILIAAWVLGPFYGFAAGGIGSMLADISIGYFAYAPATFIIKGLIALVAGALAIALKNKRFHVAGYAVSAAAGELVMAFGYFLFEAIFMYGFEGAWLGMPGNLFQGAAGAVIGCALICVLEKNVLKKQLSGSKM